MAKRRKKRALRLRIPSVGRPSTKKRAQRSHQHPELWGLALAATGVFLATLLWFRWDGGVAGGAVEDGIRGAVGSLAYTAPAILTVVGVLMVGRSALVDVRPFRTGLLVGLLGALLALGRDHGGFVGRVLEGVVATLLGTTGALIVGATAIVFGALLLSGASIGALVQRSHKAVRRATRARVSETETWPTPRRAASPPSDKPHAPPVDAVEEFPDVVGEPPPLVAAFEETQANAWASPFEETLESHPDYELPTRDMLRRSKPSTAPRNDERIGGVLVQALANFG
ncbi:MAG TPA: hypothetical protein VE444_06170, partial [Gaiellaceae bacterium]|nr:hypothetical protein [Gaiellaceae bacterium]